MNNQPYDYYIVLDFEATCGEKGFDTKKQEIIEFPSVIVNSKTLEIEDQIQIYVKPTLQPKLTDFCINLTGIQQDWVDNAPTFEKALKQYIEWIDSHSYLQKSDGKFNFCFVTMGDWDLKTMLPKQCKHLSLDYPDYFKVYCNIKVIFQELYKIKPAGMISILNHMNLKLEGRHHSGIDDTKNIARILMKLIKEGAQVRATKNLMKVK